jgi:hypothetical protein
MHHVYSGILHTTYNKIETQETLAKVTSKFSTASLTIPHQQFSNALGIMIPKPTY